MRKAQKIWFLVGGDQIGCKVFSLKKIVTLFWKEAPANLVPAAAVIREGQALSGIIGRKEFVGCKYGYLLKFKVIFKSACNTFLLEFDGS